MPPAYDFKLALTRVIEPTGGPRAELATLEDAARFIALMKPFRQARTWWDCAAELLLKAAHTRDEADIEMATAQMERALRVGATHAIQPQRMSSARSALRRNGLSRPVSSLRYALELASVLQPTPFEFLG